MIKTAYNLTELAQKLVTAAKTRGSVMALAESCTGGMASSAIVDVPGSSAVFDRSFIVYSNLAKIEILGVKNQTIDQYGAVSEEVAREMALGALAKLNSSQIHPNQLTQPLAVSKRQYNIAAAITGIAGPDGGTKQKPVGLVYIAVATNYPYQPDQKVPNVICVKNIFRGNRSEIRQSAAAAALIEMYKMIQHL